MKIKKIAQTPGLVATVVDNLNTESTTDALSAKQGKVLNEKFNYSTQEQIIGTWINGKPLYRKVLTGIFSDSESTQSVIHNISNLADIVTLRGTFYNENTGQSWSIPMYYPNEAATTIRIDSINIYLSHTGAQIHSRPFKIIVEYTKTTD